MGIMSIADPNHVVGGVPGSGFSSSRLQGPGSVSGWDYRDPSQDLDSAQVEEKKLIQMNWNRRYFEQDLIFFLYFTLSPDPRTDLYLFMNHVMFIT